PGAPARAARPPGCARAARTARRARPGTARPCRRSWSTRRPSSSPPARRSPPATRRGTRVRGRRYAPSPPDRPASAAGARRASAEAFTYLRYSHTASIRIAAPMSRPASPRWISVDARRAIAPLAIAQDVLLHLARRGLRQRAELDGVGRLEAGDALPAVLDQVLRRRLRAVAQRHEGLRPLAPALVRDGDHGAFEHCRVRGERLLDLDRRDVLAARDDHVLGPVAQLDRPVRVPDGEVARVEPAAAEGL